MSVLVDRDAVIRSKDAEDEQRKDLSDETGNHDIRPNIENGDITASGGDTTTDCLQHDGEDVAGDEDPGVELWSKPAEVRTEGEADMFESIVNPCGVEGWCEGEEDDAHFEAQIAERIVVEDELCNVAQGF